MIAPTHIVFGALSASLLGTFVNVIFSPLALSFAALGAVFPDIDTTASFIGRIFSPLALFLERRFGHRTLTHSFLGTLVFALVFLPLFIFRNKQFFLCLVLGYFSHILLDALNKSGVPLFYPDLTRSVMPGNERYRISTSSREELIFLGILVVFSAFVIPLNRIGIRGALHYLIRTPQSAVVDYLNYSAKDYRVSVEFEGIFNVSQRRIKGNWEVLGSSSKNSLIVRSKEGKIYSIGSNPQDNIRSLSIRSKKIDKITVQSQEIHLQNQPLSDIFKYIPANTVFNAYLFGYIKTYDKPMVKVSVDEFNVIKVGINRLDFNYATKEDILTQNLSNVLAIEGQILIRTIYPVKDYKISNGVYKDKEVKQRMELIFPPMQMHSSRVITLYIKDIYSIDELKVKTDDTIKKGSLLASLEQKRRIILLEYQAAQERLMITEADLKRERLEVQDTLKLKEKENQALGAARNLQSLKEQYDIDLSTFQSRINLQKLSLKKIEEKIEATRIYSPVEGRILSIWVQHTTVTLRILALGNSITTEIVPSGDYIQQNDESREHNDDSE
jgi:inner membrane protein